MWGTIVNTAAIIIGALLGTLIQRGFSRKTVRIGAGLIAGAGVIGGALSALFFQGFFKKTIFIGGVAVLLWLLLGYLLRNGLPESYSSIIMQGIGLSVVIIGVESALKTQNMLLVIMSLVTGGIIGEYAGIEKKLDSLGQKAQKILAKGENSTFSQGFVSASLLFCVGAMAIVGALDAGLKGDFVTLYAKSMLDGISSIVLAATLGIGVAFSSLAVFIYQGAITLASNAVSSYLSEAVINEMSAVGGILIVGIGLSMLDIKRFKIGNFLPAIFIPPLYFPLEKLVQYLLRLLG